MLGRAGVTGHEMPNLVPADHIEIAFQCLLGRRPESIATIAAFQALGDMKEVIAAISSSPEAQARSRNAPYWHYNSRIDALGIIRSHEKTNRKAVAGRLVNFVGVIIDPSVYPPLLRGREGQVEGLPIPANWHADIAEFAAALRAVDLAEKSFRVLELGCGWGCWLLITGVAARNRGLNVELLGAEGDAGHVAFAEKGCAENGFSEQEYRILRGVVGPKDGLALFPKQAIAGESWGLEPIFDATPAQVEDASSGGKFDILPILTLERLADGVPIDLVHIDIQGGESVFIESCLHDLTALVRYIVVGTHSREIEGRIIELLHQAGWVLEIERPAIFGIEADGRRVTLVDGVQGWRNVAL